MPAKLAIGAYCVCMLQMRDASLSDAVVIAEMHHASIFAAYASIYGPGWTPRPFEQRLETWQRHLEPGSGVDTLICDDVDAIVGFAGLGPNRDGLGDSAGEIYTLYVDAGRWRSGIGTLLLAAAEQRLRDRGYTNAVLWTLELNQRARAFYERHGWQPDGATIPDDDDPKIFEVRYRKRLAT